MSYWEQNGKHQTIVNSAQELIPSIGYTDNPILNALIAANHLYYDMYNNGSCNIMDCYLKDVKAYILPLIPDFRYQRFVSCNYEAAEEEFNKVVEYLMSQPYETLIPTIYSVWQDYENKLLSMTKRDGWSEVSFGSEGERDEWIKTRTAPSWGFQFKLDAYEFILYELDMLAGEDGGWEENDRIKLGTVKVESAEKDLEKEILKALKSFEVKVLFGGSYMALNTCDKRKVYCEDLYGSGTWFEVGEVKKHRPIYGLALTSINAIPTTEIRE